MARVAEGNLNKVNDIGANWVKPALKPHSKIGFLTTIIAIFQALKSGYLKSLLIR